MKIHIIAVGKLKERYLREGCAEFQKRLGKYCRLEISELAEEQMPEGFSEKQLQQTLQKEGERILKNIREGELCIALDLKGEQLASEQIAARIAEYALAGKSDITVVIGGAFGLADTVRQRADWRWSFSKLTFTHQIIRLLLLEQLYRSFKINRNEKYHW